MPPRLAVLLSGSGTTLENLFENIERGELDAEIAVVIGSRPSAFGLERAKGRGVPTAVCRAKDHGNDVAAHSRALFAEVDKHDVAYVICAGWMKLLSIPPAYENRVVNVHPALLPAFGGQGYYGGRVHGAVLARGVKISGCTVHFCDNEYDHGPILMQQAVEVHDDDTIDTLAERVQAAERELYPVALKALLSGSLKVDGERVRPV
jgi:phosphoribosylglycinamide formyltransferase-1